jgi:hypothetical protein
MSSYYVNRDLQAAVTLADPSSLALIMKVFVMSTPCVLGTLKDITAAGVAKVSEATDTSANVMI